MSDEQNNANKEYFKSCVKGILEATPTELAWLQLGFLYAMARMIPEDDELEAATPEEIAATCKLLYNHGQSLGYIQSGNREEIAKAILGMSLGQGALRAMLPSIMSEDAIKEALRAYADGYDDGMTKKKKEE